MRVFLSWSGEQSKEAAKAVSSWLPYVINAVNPWMSTDIQAGARWSEEVQTNLEDTRFGVLFVTPKNLTAPWLLFEAGALAKTLSDTYVCPYLLGFKKITELPQGPLVQFQAKIANRDGTRELVQTVNQALKNDSLPEDQLDKAFEMWWPDLKKRLDDLPSEAKTDPELPSSEDMIGEMLTVVRRIDRTLSGGKTLPWNRTLSTRWTSHVPYIDITHETLGKWEHVIETLLEDAKFQPVVKKILSTPQGINFLLEQAEQLRKARSTVLTTEDTEDRKGSEKKPRRKPQKN